MIAKTIDISTMVLFQEYMMARNKYFFFMVGIVDEFDSQCFHDFLLSKN